MLQFLTAGESHGKGLIGILEGMPAGLAIDVEYINNELRRRQLAFGRGTRMQIERDCLQIWSGLFKGKTTGAPIAIVIPNVDEWSDDYLESKKIHAVRPAHADFPGAIKYGLNDARIVAERASARISAINVAIGCICRQLLAQLDIAIEGHVYQIGDITSDKYRDAIYKTNSSKVKTTKDKAKCNSTDSADNKHDYSLEWFDDNALARIVQLLDSAQISGQTIGGRVQLSVSNIPIGVGGYSQNARRLEYEIMARMGSINAVKSVEIGLGSEFASSNGVDVLDEMYIVDGDYDKRTNFSGGIDGGMSNGQNIIVGIVFKPIPSIPSIKTVDILKKQNANTIYERGDVTAVFAGTVVAENVLSIAIASQLLEYCSADTVEQLKARLHISAHGK